MYLNVDSNKPSPIHYPVSEIKLKTPALVKFYLPDQAQS